MVDESEVNDVGAVEFAIPEATSRYGEEERLSYNLTSS